MNIPNWADTLGAICFVIVMLAVVGLLFGAIYHLLRSDQSKKLLLLALAGVVISSSAAFATQMGSGDRPIDFSKGSYHDGTNPYYSEQVVPPYSESNGVQGFSTSMSNTWNNLSTMVSNFFGGIGRWLMPEQCY